MWLIFTVIASIVMHVMFWVGAIRGEGDYALFASGLAFYALFEIELLKREIAKGRDA